MIESKKFTTSHNLPAEIPLFLVRGAVLMPKTHLPIPIFEAGQIPMIHDCLSGNKMIGLIQPSNLPIDDQDSEAITLYSTGCLGRITDVTEHDSARLVIALEGICRFKLMDHHESKSGYPMGRVDYTPFESDLVEEYDFSMDRPRLFAALRPYFNNLEITPNWEEIAKTSNQKLVSSLSMACPLHPSERQILLETENLKEQSELFTKLIEMSTPARHNDSSHQYTYH